MLVPWQALNGRHHATAMCRKGAERKRRRMAEAELRDSTERAFEAYGKPIETVTKFKYLGRVMREGDDNWPAVAGNLVKARKRWGRIERILIREGVDRKVSRNLFKAVVQQVLLFGAEMWVPTPRIERALESFMHGAARSIMGRQPRRGWDGKWFYPSLREAMREAGFEEIRKSITRRQNTVAQYIVTRPILDLREQDTQRAGARVSRHWWDQKGTYLKTAKERAAEALATDSESESKVESEAEVEVEAETEVGGEKKSTSSGVSGSSGGEWSGASLDPWE